MRTIYLDCTKGVSGDMLISSLLCHLKDISCFENAMTSICADSSARLEIADKVRYSFAGKEFGVHCNEGQPLRHLEDILAIVENAKLSESVKNKATASFKKLAETEAEIHGVSVNEVHFHEIGAVDTIIDIVGFFTLLEVLKIDKVVTSSINVGSGTVNCEHGVLPVPAPATANLLLGKEIFSEGENGERTTPTGAVLVATAIQGDMPRGKLISTGVGFGKKDFKDGNYLRSFLLDTNDKWDLQEYVYLMECNLDDMTPEALGFAVEVFMNEGALDVWQQPIYMKKNRLGTKLSVLCRDKDKFAKVIFKHTGTLGIRVKKTERVLRGETEFVEKNGIRIKCTGDIQKPEYEDLRREAIKSNVSLEEIRKSIK